MNFDNLKLLGLNNFDIDVYLELFNRNGTSINYLEQKFNVSKVKINNILDKLLNLGLIDYKLSGRKRIYYVKDPRAIKTLLNSLYEKIHEIENDLYPYLKEKYEKYYLRHICIKKSTRFLIIDKDYSFYKIIDLIKTAKYEIIISGVPIWFINKLKMYLIVKKEEGVNIKIYLPNQYVSNKNYKEISNFNPEFIDYPLNIIEYNGAIYNEGNIFIDRTYMIAVYYNESGDYIVYAFPGKNCINNCMLPLFNEFWNKSFKKYTEYKLEDKDYLKIKEACLSYNKPLSMRELSRITGLSGRKLKSLILKLEELNLIKIKKENKGRGRPKILVSLIKK